MFCHIRLITNNKLYISILYRIILLQVGWGGALGPPLSPLFWVLYYPFSYLSSFHCDCVVGWGGLGGALLFYGKENAVFTYNPLVSVVFNFLLRECLCKLYLLWIRTPTVIFIKFHWVGFSCVYIEWSIDGKSVWLVRVGPGLE